MYNLNQINEVHLEITQRCNAACPMCDRNDMAEQLINTSEATKKNLH